MSMVRRAVSWIVAAALSLVVWPGTSPVHAVITDVDHADDICPPTADPCVIDQRIEVAVDIEVRDAMTPVVLSGKVRPEATIRFGLFPGCP